MFILSFEVFAPYRLELYRVIGKNLAVAHNKKLCRVNDLISRITSNKSCRGPLRWALFCVTFKVMNLK